MRKVVVIHVKSEDGIKIEVPSPEHINSLRGMSFDPVTYEPVFEKTVDEAYAIFAARCIEVQHGGCNAHVTTVDKIPEKRDWEFTSVKAGKVVVDLAKKKARDELILTATIA